MALVDDCGLWNKLGSIAQVANSEIGPNGAITLNPTYAAGKFDNGANDDLGNYITFPAAHPVGVVMFEMWWKPTYSHTDTPGAALILYRAQSGTSYSQLLSNLPTYRLAMHVKIAGVHKVLYRYNSVTYTAGTLYHMLGIFDSAAGVNQRVKLYMDGVLQVPSIYSFDAAFTMPAAADIRNVVPGAANTNSLWDNLKVYNSAAFVADAIANKDNEGWPSAGGFRMINGGMLRPNMIDGSVLIH